MFADGITVEVKHINPDFIDAIQRKFKKQQLKAAILCQIFVNVGGDIDLLPSEITVPSLPALGIINPNQELKIIAAETKNNPQIIRQEKKSLAEGFVHSPIRTKTFDEIKVRNGELLVALCTSQQLVEYSTHLAMFVASNFSDKVLDSIVLKDYFHQKIEEVAASSCFAIGSIERKIYTSSSPGWHSLFEKMISKQPTQELHTEVVTLVRQ